MVEPVNLRQFRKRKQREEEQKKAEANRELHGVSSKLRKQAKKQNLVTIKKINGKRLSSED